MPSSSSIRASLALSFTISSIVPSADAFACSSVKTQSYHLQKSFSALKYRSLHHGPDIEPLTDIEKLGSDFTKMSKDRIDRFGPGDFDQYADFPSDQFDGGDSEMGLSGDGSVGLRKLGRDVSPHLARTLSAKIQSEKSECEAGTSMSYVDELLQANPEMDKVRAQQLENWATQKEIALANRHMHEKIEATLASDQSDDYEGVAVFSNLVEAGDDLEGTITLKSPINGVARHDIMLKNPYIGFARFRAAFAGEACSEWSVIPSDGYLKQKEETHFAVTFKPQNPGVSVGYLVIETEDFKKTWRVVGSTGEYEF